MKSSLSNAWIAIKDILFKICDYINDEVLYWERTPAIHIYIFKNQKYFELNNHLLLKLYIYFSIIFQGNELHVPEDKFIDPNLALHTKARIIN